VQVLLLNRHCNGTHEPPLQVGAIVVDGVSCICTSSLTAHLPGQQRQNQLWMGYPAFALQASLLVYEASSDKSRHVCMRACMCVMLLDSRATCTAVWASATAEVVSTRGHHQVVSPVQCVGTGLCFACTEVPFNLPGDYVFAGPVAEQVLLLENIATSVKVGPEQLPSIHRLMADAVCHCSLISLFVLSCLQDEALFAGCKFTTSHGCRCLRWFYAIHCSAANSTCSTQRAAQRE
jgi:hypothetical protein